MTEKNLSEQLFKPKFDYPETSTLVTPSANTRHLTNSLLDSEGQSYWYRAINRLSWQWRGLPFMETEDVLSRIAISDKKRSNPNWLDTVIGYQSGNWIYEFCLLLPFSCLRPELINPITGLLTDNCI